MARQFALFLPLETYPTGLWEIFYLCGDLNGYIGRASTVSTRTTCKSKRSFFKVILFSAS
jgi:hypothetical protein